tara:strand:+ start:3468 stop:4199 length:732 start_codon:yes stop_codon:yes gene_type:complete
MNYLIIGASSGLGRELSYFFAKKNNDLIICSRDNRDLDALKADIQNKFKIKVSTIEADITSVESIKNNFLKDKNFFKEIDGILFPIGLMFAEDQINLDIEKINQLTQANFSSISFIASAFINYKNQGVVIGFGSVSGSLGRELNPYYAASKRALESFFESTAFINKNNKINLQFYTLGYLETNLSFGKKLILPKGSVKKLSQIVYKNKNVKFKKYFFPHWWGFIILLIKIIPFSIILKFKNLK